MKNDSIEDREIVSLLRGTADLLNTPLEYPDNAGKYNLLKEKDIFHAIHELREKSAINIKGYSLDGRLFFNSYKINKEGERLLSIILEHDPERIKKDSDIMLEIELDKLENMTDKEARDFMIVFKMAKSPTFFSVQKERIKENLKNAPDMIVKMIKMKENLETDSKKKEILKEMLNFTNETA